MSFTTDNLVRFPDYCYKNKGITITTTDGTYSPFDGVWPWDSKLFETFDKYLEDCGMSYDRETGDFSIKGFGSFGDGVKYDKTENFLFVYIDLPGYDVSNIVKTTLSNKVFTVIVKGHEESAKEKTYTFFPNDEKWDLNKAKFSMKNGRLTCTIPLKETAKPKEFSIDTE